MKRIAVAISLLLVVALTGSAESNAGLADLIQAGQSQAALKAIRAGADVNQAQGDGTTPLHWAVHRVEPELVGALLAHGARPDVVNTFGASPLVEAVKIANRELVEMLLKAGAAVDTANEDGQTALMVAAGLGSMEIAELLVRRGANVNALEQWRGQTPLMWAAAENHPDIAELLIAKGADVDVRANAIEWPSQFTSEPRAQYRPHGGLTPLMYAARGGCLRCVKAMVEAGANVNRPDPDGITPLIVALDNSGYDIAKYLLEHGANPHTWDWYGRTPLYVVVDMRARGDRYDSAAPAGGRGVRRGGGDRRSACPQRSQCQGVTSWDIFQMLLDAGVDVTPQLTMHRPGGRNGENGRFADDLLTTGATPLLRAAQAFDNDVVRALLKAGAPVNLPNVMGVTPFLAAAGIDNDRGGADGAGYRGDKEAGAISTMEILLEAGADVNDRVRDTTSYTARISRRSSMTDRQGQTALFGAAQGGRMKVVRFLLDHGAKVDVADDRGKTPLDAAVGDAGGREQGGSKEILALLRSLSSKTQ